jgi:hypothetical protein
MPKKDALAHQKVPMMVQALLSPLTDRISLHQVGVFFVMGCEHLYRGSIALASAKHYLLCLCYQSLTFYSFIPYVI